MVHRATPAGLFDQNWRVMDENFVHRLSSEEHPLSDEHLLIFVLVDINMRLDAIITDVRAFNLPMLSEEEMIEVEELDRRARRRRLPTVRILNLSGDLEHPKSCDYKSIKVDDNGNFKNGQRSVFDTFMEAKDDETRHSRAFFHLSSWWYW
jgi:hypothetical protein